MKYICGSGVLCGKIETIFASKITVASCILLACILLGLFFRGCRTFLINPHQTTQHYLQEDGTLYSHRHGNITVQETHNITTWSPTTSYPQCQKRLKTGVASILLELSTRHSQPP